MKAVIIATILVFSGSGLLHSQKITEKDLNSAKTGFIEQFINDGNSRDDIKYLNLLIRGEAGNISLIDKLAIFINESIGKGFQIKKIRFSASDEIFFIHITQRDSADGQLYNLFLEYSHKNNSSYCILRDINYSVVFMEKLKHLGDFFRSR